MLALALGMGMMLALTRRPSRRRRIVRPDLSSSPPAAPAGTCSRPRRWRASSSRSGAAVHLMTDRRADAFADRGAGRRRSIGCAPAGSAAARCIAAYGLAELAVGIVQARRLLRRLTPAAVVGFGGYPSVPTMLAAAQLGLPDRDPRAKRGVRPRQPAAGAARPPHRHRLRRDAGAAPGRPRARRAHRQPGAAGDSGRRLRALCCRRAKDAPIELLVLGGSQGARFFSEIVPAALAALPAALRARLRVSQQCAPGGPRRGRGALAALGIAAEIESFFDDMPARLERAHLVICRAGASTDRRVGRCRPAGAAGALPARDGRSPDRQRRAPSPQRSRRLGSAAERADAGWSRRAPRPRCSANRRG